VDLVTATTLPVTGSPLFLFVGGKISIMPEKFLVNFALSVLFQLLTDLEPVLVTTFESAFAKLYVTIQQKLGGNSSFQVLVQDKGGVPPGIGSQP
jgi:hypothetical protein